MKPEHDRLVREIFDDGGNAAGRDETLRQGGRVLRRRRLVRRTRRVLLVALISLLPAALLWRSSILKNQTRLASRSIPASPSDEKIKELTDEQLLSLFPNTPVALAEVGGKKRLFFPRPADEARYLTRVPGN